MQRKELLAIVERLCDVELDTLERDDLAEIVASAARIRGWLDATELRCTRRARSLADAGRAESAPSLMAKNGNRSNRDADQIDRRDKVAEAMPSFEDGLDHATVSAGHLDAIANATRNAPPEVRAAFAAHDVELVALAAADSVEMFARRCRSLVAELTTDLTGNDATELDRQRAASTIRQWFDALDGLHHTHVALDPLRHEIFWNAITRNLRRRQQRDGNARTPWNQMQVDALIDAVRGESVNTQRPHPTGTPPIDDTKRPACDARPPGPAADIARDLVDAIDRATRHHQRTAEPDHDSDSNGEVGAGDDDVGGGGNQSEPDDLGDDDSDDYRYDDDIADDYRNDSEAELRRIEQRIPEISVLTDLSFLIGELDVAGICETEDGNPLPVSTVRRLCCDAEIIPIVLGANGVPLDLGRTARTVNRAQRRALRAMHRTCAHPDCDVPFSHTKIHHVRWWTRDRGPTDIDNLLPLCERHHHLVHEGNWNLSMTPDRIATWIRPDGTTHHRGATIDRRPPATDCGPPGDQRHPPSTDGEPPGDVRRPPTAGPTPMEAVVCGASIQLRP